jgi:hypothetical protein
MKRNSILILITLLACNYIHAIKFRKIVLVLDYSKPEPQNESSTSETIQKLKTSVLSLLTKAKSLNCFSSAPEPKYHKIKTD